MANTTASRFNKVWNREVQRDILALGSPVFYILTIGRALVGPFWDLLNPLVLIAVILYVLYKTVPAVDFYLARGLILATFITRHYNDLLFGLFAFIAFIGMVAAAVNIGKSKAVVTRGIWLGTALSIVGYPIAVISDRI